MTADYLVDTSALVRLLRPGSSALGWDQQIEQGLLGVCPITELEFLYTARSRADRKKILALLTETYPWIPVPDDVYRRAAQVQDLLTQQGQHRSAGPIDLLVAATAELTGLTVLHYDGDFDVIKKATGQPARWLAPPGTIR
ncbi:PIN domain nuclease [Catellatospora sp. NPDC049609]|uniref:PIN domain nuclease n=1 Tax=Catellatospora sp. NPDC049609 TaxID=3155505 RepID=UPI00343EAC96